MVLGHSLRDNHAKGKLVACIVMDKISEDSIKELRVCLNSVHTVHVRVLTDNRRYTMTSFLYNSSQIQNRVTSTSWADPT